MAHNVHLSGFGKKIITRVTPGTLLVELRDVFCEKYSLSPAQNYGLRHHHQRLDLTLSVRLAGLAAGAKIEVFRLTSGDQSRIKEGNANIALQLPTGGRVQKNCSLQSTVWDLLESSGVEIPEDVVPVVESSGRELKGEERLRGTTLADMAVAPNSRCLLRLFLAKSTIPSTQPKVTTNDTSVNTVFLKEKEPEGESVEKPSPVASPSQKDVSVESTEKIEVVKEKKVNVGSRETRVFVPTAAAMKVDELPDSFYEVTPEDVGHMAASLKNEVEKLEFFGTRKTREAMISHYKYDKTILRIRIAEVFVQASFRPNETVGDVENFVRSCLKNPTISLSLFTYPPKREYRNSSATLKQEELVPAVIVNASFDEENSRKNAQEVLCDTLLREVEALQRTEVPSPLGKHDSRKQKGISRGRSSNTAVRTDYSSTSENDNKPKRKWPKWLRLGRK